MSMFYSLEQEKGIYAEQQIRRSGTAKDVSLCKYREVACVRCCLPHIGGDTHMEDSEETRNSLLQADNRAYQIKYSARYLGPRGILMKFTNFNPMRDPRIEASQYEDSLPDVGRDEMERRFAARRGLFLALYDREHPRQSLPRYMTASQENEGYTYKPEASTGLITLYIGGSVPSPQRPQRGLPECQLLGFVDGKGTVGCMAHPLAETSQGYDGRDQVGFFNHTGCCENVGCEASFEFRFLSQSALKIFYRAVEGLSWYEYSRHATSVLVYYLRSYDYALQRLDAMAILDVLSLEQLVAFTNTLYEEWPLRDLPDSLRQDSSRMNSLDLLSTDIPLAERILYIALNTRFSQDHFARQLPQARHHVEGALKRLKSKT
jgi:hypothetical protein